MEIQCPNCSYEGKGKRITKGSFAVEVVLWLLFLLPGLVYSVWRLSNKVVICPQCRFEHVRRTGKATDQGSQARVYKKLYYPKTNMKYLTFLLLIIVFVPTAIVSAEDMVLETKDGREVVLHEDGSWEYTKTNINNNNQNDKIAIRGFLKTPMPIDLDAGRYSNKVQLTLYIENNTSKMIKAWRATLNAENPFGDLLFKCQLTAGEAAIMPGQAEQSNFVWEDNQFTPGEIYDHVITYSEENLKLSLTDIKVIH